MDMTENILLSVTSTFVLQRYNLLTEHALYIRLKSVNGLNFFFCLILIEIKIVLYVLRTIRFPTKRIRNTSHHHR